MAQMGESFSSLCALGVFTLSGVCVCVCSGQIFLKIITVGNKVGVLHRKSAL